MNVKAKSNLVCLFNKKTLFVSLFFIVMLISFPLIPEANGGWFIHDNVYVYNETELRDAISAVSDSYGYLIVIEKDIELEKSLEIPEGKRIDLAANARLIGCDGADTIIVRSGGELTIWYGLIVTHAEGAVGRGVYVERNGTFNLYGGRISGNSADNGGGVYNAGMFTMHGDVNGEDVEIFGNTATQDGGGVYNIGTFSMSNWRSRIRGNTATNQGGGVYNAGTFNSDDCVISENVALSDEGDDVFIKKDSDSGQLYLFTIGIVIVGFVVVSLVFYRSKSQKQSIVKDLGDSANVYLLTETGINRTRGTR